ncbi:hypothetical protein Aph01nite_42060 [Acrocarpospora phusangensis]|uniref:Uncharacterized protein n=1 Tax=Acrocarpospora phusangensis TaxID=1070424 RepID=A0A919QDE3_9ACTN|nr:hypothetical protein [Acrocarpospora phusangensis]GIH25896.1 hypothetical protein Aph01nite_42060 [Acrocarpospora phusangensis]
MIKMMRENGLTSQHMYLAGFASVALSATTWLMSNLNQGRGMSRTDHWGIFMGEWAPTFFALGIALRLEEMQDGRHDMMGKSREGMERQMAGNARMSSPA